MNTHEMQLKNSRNFMPKRSNFFLHAPHINKTKLVKYFVLQININKKPTQ